MSDNPTDQTQKPSQGGTLAFDPNKAMDGEIVSVLNLVKQLITDYKDDGKLIQGLKEIQTSLQTLRLSNASEAEIRKKLDELQKIEVSEGKFIRLDAFRKTAAKSKLSSMDDYGDQVRKMVRNTMNNLALLMLGNPDDGVLQRFMNDLRNLDMNDPRQIKIQMGAIRESPQLWHYNEKKKGFLIDWLKPYESLLGIPIDEMSEEDFNEALKKVEGLREKKLEDLTHLEMIKDRAPYRIFNKSMSPIINGRDEAFWGGEEIRDEFVHFINLLIIRFSFNLEDRFLVFKTKDGGFIYLVGFADEAFDNAVEKEDGRIGLYPHLKVLLKTPDGFSEITMEAYNRNPKSFYSTIRTSVVPFLSAVALMVETDMSEELRSAFDMWV